ncbi:SacI homology domain-containing protein [Schizophyllum commune]
MKKFFNNLAPNRGPKAAAATTTATSTPATPLTPTVAHTTGLQAKFVIPPVPHPAPYHYLCLLARPEGLLVRPHLPGEGHDDLQSYVRVPWGSPVKAEEVQVDEKNKIDWSQGAVVYGLLGSLDLFSGAYVLVITSKADIGNFLDASRAVYGVKGVTAIPMDEERARRTIISIASRNKHLARPSVLVRSSTMDTVGESGASDSEESPETPKAKVQFADEADVKIMTPRSDSSMDVPRPYRHSRAESVDSLASDISASSSMQSSDSMSNISSQSSVAQTLASRLSFWKTTRAPATTTAPGPSADTQSTAQEDNANVEEVNEILAAATPAAEPVNVEERNSQLDDKIVKECIREFTKGDMYLAYNFDITRCLQHKQELIAKSQKQHALMDELTASQSGEVANSEGQGPHTVNVLDEPHPTLPLWRRVNRQFWWNESLSKAFVDAGLHSYVLPVMQGYYQISTFQTPQDPITGDQASVDYIIISRRSRDRAGLRYQRRGIDDDAHVANFVETETVMRVEREGSQNVFSYLQIRGSIPLFWTQTGYGLKPPPVLAADHTPAQNIDAMKRHFQRTLTRYGPHTIVNLAEQGGKEGAITGKYREFIKEVGLPDVHYHEYDFHAETKGMKYENISKLITALERTFEQQGYLWLSGDRLMSTQKGVFRTNCIDCLDRTNVVQSAFARFVLNKQLGAVALTNSATDGQSNMDVVFNDMWANNGDAISRAYAGTSALKGDFTRTGKRDIGGMLNDGVNSLARMYASTFGDWFSQAVIDYMLGYRTLTVFSEFLLKLQSTDPGELIRLSKIRAEAIATSVSRVLDEGERLLSAWTVLSPEGFNVKIGPKFEEKVLLLTARALYIIRYDYTLEKVKAYTRVPLGDITGITKGAYILSPLEEASRDPKQNAGFVVRWISTNQTTRVSSYSVKNTLDASSFLPVSKSDSPITGSPLSSSPTTESPSKNNPLTSTNSPSRRFSIPASLSNLNQSISNSVNPLLPRKRKTLALSDVLSKAESGGEVTFAAFKVLQIDPTRTRHDASGGSVVGGTIDSRKSSVYAEPADELSGARDCQEAVDMIVDAVQAACKDIGGGVGSEGEDFVKKEDIVSVSEAERLTTMYAKMEYGLKRLLWLGS